MISIDVYLTFCDEALDGYAACVRELGDAHVNSPLTDIAGSNSAFALVAHAADPGAPPVNPPTGRGRTAYATQGAVLMHVHEELAQHLGHLEVTRDVLLASG